MRVIECQIAWTLNSIRAIHANARREPPSSYCSGGYFLRARAVSLGVRPDVYACGRGEAVGHNFKFTIRPQGEFHLGRWSIAHAPKVCDGRTGLSMSRAEGHLVVIGKPYAVVCSSPSFRHERNVDWLAAAFVTHNVIFVSSTQRACCVVSLRCKGIFTVHTKFLPTPKMSVLNSYPSSPLRFAVPFLPNQASVKIIPKCHLIKKNNLFGVVSGREASSSRSSSPALRSVAVSCHSPTCTCQIPSCTRAQPFFA